MKVRLRTEIRRPEFAFLTAAALLTRVWGLFNPRVVVWDEIHFEHFAGSYLTGKSYLDVHPPLGKMLLAGAARLLGIPGQALLAGEPAPALRLLPAIAGALIISVVYLLMRGLGASRRVATFAAAMLVVDNALVVESRFALTDSMLILFGFSALLLFVMGRRTSGTLHWVYLMGAGVAAGMAASVKWTGLSALGLMLTWWAASAYSRRGRAAELAKEIVILVALPGAVYVAAFAVHFALLGRAGPDAGVSFARALVNANREMEAINAGWVTDANPGASPWYTWPIAKHSVSFWAPSIGATGNGPQRWIILFGNPVVWFGALAGMVATGIAAVARRAAFARHRTMLAFLAAGYALNFIPFAFIRRPMYLYHYFCALIFSVMIAAVGLGLLAGWMDDDAKALWRFPSRASARIYAGALGLAAVTFLYLAPMSYGWPLSARAVLHRRWLLERRVTDRQNTAYSHALDA